MVLSPPSKLENGMGLMDAVIGALGQGGGLGKGGPGNPDLMRVVLAMLGNDGPTGGLGGLVEKFNQAGMGDVIASWISTGQNAPISGDRLGQVLGGDLLGNIASQLGTNPGDASGQLAQWLPQIVDRLTPQGQAPEGGLGSIGDLLGMLGRS
jgi:uncharacterized protein YidB (DUF937 family)